MTVSPEFRDYVLELLEPLGPVSAKSMFGGAGIYLDGIMFALITSTDVFYFRTDEVNRGDFEAEGMEPFIPRANKPYTMPYHEAPPDTFEDSELFCLWARKAWEAARRERDKKGKGK